MLNEGAMSHPARITSSLSVEYLWGHLVPDFAALVRSLCVALEAWPQEVAKPALFPDPGDVKLDAPLGLQYKVRLSILHVLRVRKHCRYFFLANVLCTNEQPPEPHALQQDATHPILLSQTSVAARAPVRDAVRPAEGQPRRGGSLASRIH